MIIAGADLRSRIDIVLASEVDDEKFYKIYHTPSLSLLTFNRLDLGFKLFYLKYKNEASQLARDMYVEHLRSLSLGQFVEPGDSEKTTIEEYIHSFDIIFNDIKNNGFKSSTSIIPIAKNDSILNGSHRIASAIHLGVGVDSVKFDSAPHHYDYAFFRKRCTPERLIKLAVLRFSEACINCFIGFAWPAKSGVTNEVDKVLTRVVFKETISLNFFGARRLLSEIYSGEKWIGNLDNNFQGVDSKLFECFKCGYDVTVYIFEADSLQEVLDYKNRIRTNVGCGKHSIHITDTHTDTLRLSKLTLNDNSIAMMNHGTYYDQKIHFSWFQVLKNYLSIVNIGVDDILLNEAALSSLFGIRTDDCPKLFCGNEITIGKLINAPLHIDERLKDRGAVMAELIYNNSYYLYFDGVKVISPAGIGYLSKFVSKSLTDKHLNLKFADENIRSTSRIKPYMHRFFVFGFLRFRRFIIYLLQVLRVYEVVKSIKKKLS